VLSGRSRAKLEALADELPGDVRIHPAALDDPSSLHELLGDCAAVIACAGPFTLHGEPVLSAAVETATHYLDTTGEQRYMQMAFERYGPRAERAGVAVVPAMGFDYVPGDLIAALTAEGMGELDELSLAYAVAGFAPTRGTALSALEIIHGGGIEWRDGRQRDSGVTRGAGRFDFGEEIGTRQMVDYPAGEQVTVPRHVRARNVRTTITASTIAPHPRLGFAMPVLAPATALAMRTPVRRLAGSLIARLREGPTSQERAAARFTIVCDARGSRRSRRGTIRGRDVYGLTGAAVARGALLTAREGYDRSGALAPAQAFDPSEFLAGLSDFGVGWSVEDAGAQGPGGADSPTGAAGAAPAA